MSSSLFTIIATTESIDTVVSTAGEEYFVKRDYDGTGDAGDITIAENNVDIVIDCNCSVTQKFVLSGNNIGIQVLPGGSIGDVDSTGTGNHIDLENGATGGEMQQITSGATLAIRGNGFGAQVDSVRFERDGCFVNRISVDSKTPTTGNSAISTSSAATKARIELVNIINSDVHGIYIVGNDSFVFGNTVQGCDESGMVTESEQLIVIGNHILNASDNALKVELETDNSTFQANYFNDGDIIPVIVETGASANVFTANQMINQIVSIGGTDTTAADNRIESASGSVAMWLDAALDSYSDAGSTAATDTDGVQEWHDQIAGVVFSQTTAGRQPVFTDSVQNTLPGIDFDGIDDFLEHTTALFSGTSGYVFAVVRLDATTGAQNIISSSDTGSTTRLLQALAVRSSKMGGIYYDDNSTDIDVTVTSGTSFDARLVTLGSNGSAYRFKVNGAEEVEIGSNSGEWFGDIVSATLDNTILGALKSTVTANYLKGKILEIIVVDGSTPSETEIDTYENYLNAKYAIF